MNEFYRGYLEGDPHRAGTDCEKWDDRKSVFGRADVLPMWVADMDFPTVPAVTEALVERAKHPIYGYTMSPDRDREAEAGWLKRRHGMDASPEWILYSPGVVDSMLFCVRALTKPGDSVVIQPPVYGPFYSVVERVGRVLRKSELLHSGNEWAMDYEDLEAAFKGGAKLMLLCSPHNPIGKIWSRDELTRLIDLANRYGVVIVSDEIHAEFAFDKVQQRILSLPGSDRCVMLTSATKAFNLAGLRQSSVLVKDEALRKAIRDEIWLSHADTPNIFGAIAQRVAYETGDMWMDAVLEYIRENRDLTVETIRREMPSVGAYPQEGTYLMWLDFSSLGLDDHALMRRMVDVGGVGMTEGVFFGPEGSGHLRFNLATQRRNVAAALEGIKKAVGSRA